MIFYGVFQCVFNQSFIVAHDVESVGYSAVFVNQRAKNAAVTFDKFPDAHVFHVFHHFVAGGDNRDFRFFSDGNGFVSRRENRADIYGADFPF